MARVTFEGAVRGYSVGDDGRVWLSIDESNPSQAAEMRVHDMVKGFNPSSGKHGFGSKDVPCPIKPGFASYRVAISPDEAALKGIIHGSIVELTVDVSFIRRVVFVSGRNGKQGRWAGIPELVHEVVSVRPVTAPSTPKQPVPETTGTPTTGGGRNK